MRLQSVRIDKWLWAARFFKTRVLAHETVKGGHVQINGEKAKPSRAVQINDTVILQRDQESYVVQVTGLAEKRGSAAIARTLYEETPESMTAREELGRLRKLHAASAPAPDKRPDKKSRRQIIRFIKKP